MESSEEYGEEMTSGADKIASSIKVLCLRGEDGREVELVVEAMCSETREESAEVPCRLRGRKGGKEF